MCSTSTPNPPSRKASRRFDDVVRARMAENGPTLTSVGYARSLSRSRTLAILRRPAHEDVSDMEDMALDMCGTRTRAPHTQAGDDLVCQTRVRACAAHAS